MGFYVEERDLAQLCEGMSTRVMQQELPLSVQGQLYEQPYSNLL